MGDIVGDMATCDVCGTRVKRRGLGVHRRRKHGIAGLGPGSPCPYCGKPHANPHEHLAVCPERPADTGRAPRGAKPVPYPTTPPLELVEPRDAGNGHCADCPWRGLERAIDRSLVEEAVRGGMGLEAAAAFVRRVRETR